MSSGLRGKLLGVAVWLAATALVLGALAPGIDAIGASADDGERGARAVLDEARRAYDARQVDRAEALFREALTLAESGGLAREQRQQREQAEALLGLGQIELESDRRTAAKGSLERALTLFEGAGNAAEPGASTGAGAGYAQALAASGQALVLLGEAEEGLRRVRTAIETLRARVDASRGDEARGGHARSHDVRRGGVHGDDARGDDARGGGTPGDAVRRGARDDVEALARASAILISVMPPGPAKDTARDAAFEAARASASRGHECAIRHAWGGDLLRAGEYAEAWRVLTEAVSCYEGVPNDRRLASALISLGSLKRTHGQFDAALAAFERAVTVSRERHDPVGTVVALNAVATGQTDLWRTDEARASLEAALKLARARKMETLTTYTVGQLGAHFTQIGQFAAAIPLLEESLAHAATVPRQIERLTQLCAAHARAAGAGAAGARAALPVCDRNVTLARGDSPNALLYALRARAEARRRSGALDDASADLREAIELVEDLRARTVPIDFMKRGFSAWHEWLFGSSIAVTVQQRDVSRALETAERARSRALLDLLATREVNAQSPAIANASAVPTPGASASVTAGAAPARGTAASGGVVAPRPSSAATSGGVTLGAGLTPRGEAAPSAVEPLVAPGTATGRKAGSAAEARVAGAASPRAPTSATSSAATRGAVASEVAALSGGGLREGVLPRLDSSAAAGAATVPDMIATARRLQSTLLVYWVNPDAVYIWTITPKGAIHDARVEVPMAKVIGLVAATRAPASQDPAAGLFALKASSSRRPWRELHDLLIAPVQAHLPKAADALLTIVPHGPLAQLSFAALQDAQGSYLLERYTLHYTPAVGVLAYTAKRQEERRQAAQAANAGRAANTRADGPAAGDARANDAAGAARASGGRSGDAPTALLVGDPGEVPAGPDGTPLSALPWARREVTEVAALVGGRATVLTDAQATEAAVRDSLAGRSILHFATHGVVREDETLGSFLALRGGAQTAGVRPSASSGAADAGGARNGTEAPRDPAGVPAAGDAATDGRLTADEVYALKLDADLVVLSACSSALGPTGTEGVIGFTRAFLYAGAASVIATSWNVPDASSYELMHRFYRERARRDAPATATDAAPASATARALRAAQLSTLAALRQGKVTITTPGDLNGRGTTIALPDHPLFWAGFIVVGEP